MRAKLSRRLAGTAGAFVLLATGMLASAGTVQASPPNWVMEAVALPSTVTAGATAGYRVTITNNGPSNISALYLTTKVGDLSGIAPTYVDDGAAGPVPCTEPDVPLKCSFGPLNDDQSVTIVVAYTATGTGSFNPGFQANTTGQTFTDPKRSHGDTLEPPQAFTGTSLSGDKNFGGKFNVAFGGFVSNNASLTGQNKQSTKVSHLPAATAATVLDGPGVNVSCTPDPDAGIDCTKLFGEASQVNVGTGGPFASALVIEISFKSGVPNAFLHVTTVQSLVSRCAGNVAPTDPGQLPCFTWDGKNTASIYTLENGVWKGL